jgi:hypothetical protein
VKRIESVPRPYQRRHIATGVKVRAKNRIKPVIQNGSKGQNSQDRHKEKQRIFFHVVS